MVGVNLRFRVTVWVRHRVRLEIRLMLKPRVRFGLSHI